MNLSRNIKITIFFIIITGITVPLIAYNFTIRNDVHWELLINGNVSKEIDISYQDLVDGKYGTVVNQTYQFLDIEGHRANYTYTGVSVWNILSETHVLNNNSTAIEFKSYDLYVTSPLNLTKIQEYPNLTIIAYKLNGKFLTTKEQGGDGPLRAIIDLSVTTPTYNSQYWAKYVNEIYVI